jgi:hypothetical protein
MTWRLQDRAGITRTPTAYAEQRTTSVPFLGWIRRLWERRQQVARRLSGRAQTSSVPTIICRIFGPACTEAISVARCESRFSIHAANGQYLGIFQMGSSERATYATIGYATAYEQIVAAHNYYVRSGWAPWACA